MTNRKAYACMSPIHWQDEAAMAAACQRFAGYALLWVTFPIPVSFVDRLRSETGARVIGYFAPLDVPITDHNLDPAKEGLRQTLTDGGDLWVRRARDHTVIEQYAGSGKYIHNEETAEITANWLKGELDTYHLDGYLFDNLPPVMSPWLQAYFSDQARPSRVLEWGGKVGSVNTLALRYEKMAPMLLDAIRQAIGPEPILTVNAGMPWRRGGLDGIMFEDNYNPGSWISSQPPYSPAPRTRYDMALIRDDADKERREAMPLSGNVLRCYEGV